eukprot:TRINITY_DN28717_c0_g2_i1.p1 TRINITY_DN28717_c0_g2~~TRINITY_DN28717_c0_g2_i1.p1  ORF type:complete len:1287 (+),score=208.52 TRINITY_DN28717_c0_g2_i1:42-3902(+)
MWCFLTFTLASLQAAAGHSWCNRDIPENCFGRQQSSDWNSPVKVNSLPPKHSLAIAKGQNSSYVLAFSRYPEGGLLPVRRFHVEEGFNLKELGKLYLQNVTGEVVSASVWDWNNDSHWDIFLLVSLKTETYTSKKRLLYFQYDDIRLSFVETPGLFDALDTDWDALQVTDWFSNGHPDLVFIKGSSMFFLKGTADHGITPLTGSANPFQDIRWIPHPHTGFLIVDWDGDGDLDLIISDASLYTLTKLRYFERVADGSLRERTSDSNPFKGLEISDGFEDGLFSLEDTPGGYPSIMLQHYDGLHVYRRQISQTLVKFNEDWTPFKNLHAQNLPIPEDWSTADLDRDGKIDLLLCSEAGLQYVRQDVQNVYTVHEGYELGVNVSNCRSPRAVDFDGDGHFDILLARSADSMGLPSRDDCADSVIQFFRNFNGIFVDQGPLRWENASVIIYEGRPLDDCSGSTGPDAVFEVADWDNDGLPELLLGSAYFTPAYMGAGVPMLHLERLQNSTRMVMVSREDSIFASLDVNGFSSLQATDWSGDGRTGLMSASKGYHSGISLTYYSVLEDGNLSAKELPGADSTLIQYHAVDWDGDGTPELLAKAEYTQHFSLTMFGQGTCSDSSGCNSGGYCDSASRSCKCSSAHDGVDCSSCHPNFWTSSTLVYSAGRQCLPCDGLHMERSNACSGRGTCHDDASARLLLPDSLTYSKALVRGSGTCSCSDDAFEGKACNLGVCPAGTYETRGHSQQTSSCEPSPAGSYASSNSTDYIPCKAGFYSERGWAECSKCPTGKTTAAPGTGINKAACNIDTEYWLLLALLLAECTCFCFLLLTVVSSTPVADVTVESNTIMVQTVRRHFFLKRALVPLKLQMHSTGHPVLDSSEKSYLGEVMGPTSFQLLEHDGEKVEADAQSSMGRAYITPLRRLLCTGIFGVPMVVLLAFFAVTIFCTLSLQVKSTQAESIETRVLRSRTGGQKKSGHFWWYLNVVGPLALLLAMMLKALHWNSLTPLAKRLQNFKKVLRAENPEPQTCPRGPSRAVTCGQLLDLLQYFQGFIIERNMYYLCANIVLPLTKPHQLSYAELAGPKDVVWFVSHFWGSPFRHFVDSIRKHSQSVSGPTDWRMLSYWVCTFSNNQWRVKEEVGTHCEDSSFHLALRSRTCTGTAMVMDGDALPLTRSWCLYEVLTTLNLTQLRSDFQGLWLCTDTGVLNRGAARVDIAMCIGRRLSTLRLEDASASNQEDKNRIDERVRTMDGGFPAVNNFVRSRIQEAILATKHVVEDDFSGLLTQFSSAAEP